jgi:signal transduction histidine kinase
MGRCMNRLEALSKIFSRSTAERLEAARLLSDEGIESDLSVIRLALGSEAVPWIRSALEAARSRLERGSTGGSESASIESKRPSLDEDVKHETIGQVLHELTPAIGRLKMAVMREYDGYVGSQIEKEFEKIAELVDLFSRWRRVNSSPRYTSVDIQKLLNELVEDEASGGVPVVVRDDPRMPLIVTDREFLKAAIANGLRNAIQAIESKGVARTGEECVTVSYGATDREFWISVNDDGVGLSGKSEAVFAATTTTKPGHSGLGLPIAREAINKLGGRLSLTSALPAGAKFLIEVPLRAAQA